MNDLRLCVFLGCWLFCGISLLCKITIVYCIKNCDKVNCYLDINLYIKTKNMNNYAKMQKSLYEYINLYYDTL